MKLAEPVKPRQKRDARTTAFNKRKAELRSLYKRYKVGLVVEEDLTSEQKVLLIKYYGVKFGGEDGFS